MNRRLQYINLIGVIAVATLCVAQWQTNRRLNLQTNELEKTKIEQTGQIQDQSQKIKGQLDDIETFRSQLIHANSALKEEEAKLAAAKKQAADLAAEREQLKGSISNWAKAVAERDQNIKEANERIQKMATDLNASIAKYNSLATNFNAVVNDLNILRTQAAAAATNQPATGKAKE